MSDERVQRVRYTVDPRDPKRLSGALREALEYMLKDLLVAYEELEAEYERLRQERDEMRRQRNDILNDYGIAADDADRNYELGAKEEREHIARLFDDLYPEWAQMIREGVGDE